MPFISITRLRVRSFRFLPFFALNALRARRQVKNATGFRGGSLLADRALTFWTMTAWDSQANMRLYMTTGSHKGAMPHLLDWCDEASVVHWEQADETLPFRTEADRRMRESGRASKVRHPSNQHASLSYRDPRTTRAVPIKPGEPKGN